MLKSPKLFHPEGLPTPLGSSDSYGNFNCEYIKPLAVMKVHSEHLECKMVKSIKHSQTLGAIIEALDERDDLNGPTGEQ